MRLLRVEDLGFDDVPSHGSCPEYAILSHTWIHPSHNEVSLQDMLNIDRTPEIVHHKAGWTKLSYLINQARRSNLRHVWMDTCCINQSNPTELNEAINCMFNWYSRATVCYVYLDDVDLVMERNSHFQYSQEALDLLVEALQSCRWVQRGWTLQELLAPAQVLFFDRSWTFLMGSADGSQILADATGVDIDMLAHKRPLYSYSIAQRLSWAACRKTTFPEDRAYSLVGLFGITMTAYYGEGERRAVERLQEEIVKISTDQSLFAWHGNDDSLLAPSLQCFRDRGHIVPRRGQTPVSYHIDNIGLQIDLCTSRAFAMLDCRSLYDPSIVFLLRLRPDPTGHFMIDPARRCEEIDWRTLRHREKQGSLLRRSISIRKSAAPYDWSDAGRICDSHGPWHLKLRLPVSGENQIYTKDGLIEPNNDIEMARVIPREDWRMTDGFSDSWYYKPSSIWKVDGPLQGTGFCIKWLNTEKSSGGQESQSPFWRYATVAFAYGQRSSYAKAAASPLPILYAQKTRDTSAIVEACSHVRSQAKERLVGRRTGPVGSLPLTRCLWYRQHFSHRNVFSEGPWLPQWQQLRIILDKAEIAGETFWELDVLRPQNRNAFHYLAWRIRGRSLDLLFSVPQWSQESLQWAASRLTWILLWSWHYILLAIEWSPLIAMSFALWKVDVALAILTYGIGLFYCHKTEIGRPRVVLTAIVAFRLVSFLLAVRGNFWIWLSDWLKHMPQYQTRTLPWSQIWLCMVEMWRWVVHSSSHGVECVGNTLVVAV